MFNRIALMWVWALILLAGILYPPDWSARFLTPWLVLLSLAFLWQCVFIVIMTRREYQRLLTEHGILKERAYDVEEQVLRGEV